MSPKLTLLALAALSAACAGSQQWVQRDLQEWVGAPVAELLDAWGPPLRTMTERDGTTVLVYESFRQLDHRLEKLQDPGAPLRSEGSSAIFMPVDRSDCTLHFGIEAEHVARARHEGAACNIVARDPARRRTDPELRQRR
jgi:hypothetical protein